MTKEHKYPQNSSKEPQVRLQNNFIDNIANYMKQGKENIV